MDLRLVQAEKDLKELAKFEKKFKETEQNIKVLQDFYQSDDWMEGREKLPLLTKEDDEYFYSSSEDGIWNTMQDFYQEKIKMLKLITKSL